MSLNARKIYSITDVARETGIPQKQVSILLEHYGDEIPVLMDGERRRYPPEAVPVLIRLWTRYKQGIKEDKAESAWYGETLERLQDSSGRLAEIAKALKALQAELRDHPPLRIFYINTLPGGDLRPTRPIAVHVDIQGSRNRAMLIDADLEAYGESESAAVLSLREAIMRTFLRLERGRTQEEEEQFSVLSSLITRESRKRSAK